MTPAEEKAILAIAMLAAFADAQQLAAPRLPVATQPDAVQGQPEHRVRHALLGAHRRDVRVMVLHAQRGDAALPGDPFRQPGAEKIGMQIVRDDGRVDALFHAQQINRLLQSCAAFGIDQITQ